MVATELTPRQTEILRVIRELSDASGYPPTRAELAHALGFRSINAAEEHLQALARKGALSLQAGTSRGIRLKPVAEEVEGPMSSDSDDPGLPVVGRVAAGSPILAEQHIEAHIRLDAAIFHPRADYLLRVHGLSMRDAGILDGDLLAVHRTPEAGNGQLVVARLEDEVTVKRFERHGHTVRLLPANPDFSPIEIDLRHQALTIEGIGVGVLRRGAAV